MMSKRDWIKQGRCAQPGAPGADFFFTFHTRDAAKEFCQACGVRVQCLEFALTEVDPGNSDKIVSTLGVWGGVDGGERVRMRQARRTQTVKDQHG